MTKKQLALEVIERLKKEYPDADCTLDYDQAWKLLVSVRLAAQCTDERVNIIVEKLYEKFPDVEALANAEVDEIDPVVQEDRLARLMAVQKEISLARNQAKIGQVIEVLVEEKEALNNKYRGRSSADAPDEVDGQVIFTCDEDLELGTFVQVEIQEASAYDLIGTWKESKA